MPNRNRETLKKYFKKGSMPSQSQFEDLIDSMFVKGEDEFDAQGDGLDVTADTDNRLVSFFANIDQLKEDATWTIKLDHTDENLLFNDVKDRTLVSLSAKGRVGIGTKVPNFTLDVRGPVSMKGRVGDHQNIWSQKNYEADGSWHTVLSDIKDPEAFEVTAAIGDPEKQRYAIMHSIAICAAPVKPWLFGLIARTKNKITTTQAYNRSCRSKMDLRWKRNKEGDCHLLQVRSRRNYKLEKGGIRVSITKLWYGPFEKKNADE